MGVFEDDLSRRKSERYGLNGHQRRVLYLQRKLSKPCRPRQALIRQRAFTGGIKLAQVSGDVDRAGGRTGDRKVLECRDKGDERADRALVQLLSKMKRKVFVGKVNGRIHRLLLPTQIRCQVRR